MDSDSDFYGEEDQVAILKSRVLEFDIALYWRKQEEMDIISLVKKEEEAEEDTKPSMSADLHNPYAGLISAWQLNETVDDFLTRLPPATTDVTFDIPWIYTCNPYIPRKSRTQSTAGADNDEAPEEAGSDVRNFMEGGMERLHLFTEFVEQTKKSGKAKTVISRTIGIERGEVVGDILMLAQVCRVRTGKWMLFVEPTSVNTVWETVARATISNELGIAAKVAPRGERGSPKARLICIYTYDFKDKDDVGRVLSKLRQLQIVRAGGRQIYYKADAYTHLGLASGNPWDIKASLYGSTEISGYLAAKKGEQSEVKEKIEDKKGKSVANIYDKSGWTF